MKTIQVSINKLAIALFGAVLFSSALQAQRFVRVVPRHNTVIVHHGVSYYYANGCYYRPHHRGYVVVTPPVGLHVRVLPVGYTNVVIGGRTYYYFGGVYYVQQEPDMYTIVEAPNGAYLVSLPANAKVIIIKEKRYYKVNNMYYEKLVSENGDERYVAVGEVVNR